MRSFFLSFFSLATVVLSILLLGPDINITASWILALRQLVTMSSSGNDSAQASQWVQDRLGLFFGNDHPSGEGSASTVVKQSFADGSKISVNDDRLSVEEFMQQLQSVAATTLKTYFT